MDCNCKNCEEKRACIPFFEHENVLVHYNRANRRMLIALLTVCLTFIITIIVFTNSYTQREKNWLDTLTGLRNSPTATAEAMDAPGDGVQQ